MNYGVMFSIQAQHTAKIFEVIGYENKKIVYGNGDIVYGNGDIVYGNGDIVHKKTLEVRKTRPKLPTPFKGFIYETKGVQVVHFDGCDITYRGRGKVIGEFICDKIEKIEPCFEYYSDGYDVDDDMLAEMCLTREELMSYGKGKTLYGIHITELVIYKEPRELSEFKKPCDGKNGYCSFNGRVCKYRDIVANKCKARYTSAPQSWGYVST